MDNEGTDGAECRQVASGKKVAGPIRLPVNGRDLQIEVVEYCMKH